ncbi:hypothetical protein GCM10027342_53890 [Photobacterium alginatilyticum]
MAAINFVTPYAATVLMKGASDVMPNENLVFARRVPLASVVVLSDYFK